METLNQTLRDWLTQTGNNEQVEQETKKLMAHPDFQRWWMANPQVNEAAIQASLVKIKQYIEETDNCRGCTGLEHCCNMMHGHSTNLMAYQNMLDVVYSPCPYWREEKKQRQKASLIQSHHIPKDILRSSFQHMDTSDERRLDALNAVLQFCRDARPGENGTGIYLYGPLGTGKSYLLGAVCNKLAQDGIDSYMVYTPAYFQEIKMAIGEKKVDDKVRALKEVSVLVLDDIGAETISAWIRDEILGAILQYRMMERLPTLYTSNYDYNQLEEHLAYSNQGGTERLKAKRIMERIRHYTQAYFVDGPNRRAQ